MKYVSSVILILVIVILIVLFYIPWKYNIFINQVKPEFKRFTQLFSSQIDNFFEQEYSKMKLISKSQYLRVALFQYMINKKRKRHLRRYIKEFLYQNNFYEAVFLKTTKDKRIIHASRKNFNFNKMDVNKKFHLFLNDIDKRYYFYLAVEIKNNFNNVIGSLVVIFSYDAISILGRNFAINKYGYPFIINNKGECVYYHLNNSIIDQPWLNYDFSKIKETEFFMDKINGKSYVFSISRCSVIPFFAGIMQSSSEFIKPYNTILIIIAGFAGILLIIFLLNIFYFPDTRQKGVKLYDSYMENFSTALTQMAKTSQTASESTALAYESLKKEVDTIKTILNDFYKFMDKRDSQFQTASSQYKPKVSSEPINHKAENIEGEVDLPHIKEAEEKGEEIKKEIKEEKITQEEKQVSIPESSLKKKKKRKKLKEKRAKQHEIEKTDYSALPSEGLIEEDGIIIRGKIDKENIKNMEISNKLIILNESDLDLKEGLTEQDGQIVDSKIEIS